MESSNKDRTNLRGVFSVDGVTEISAAPILRVGWSQWHYTWNTLSIFLVSHLTWYHLESKTILSWSTWHTRHSVTTVDEDNVVSSNDDGRQFQYATPWVVLLIDRMSHSSRKPAIRGFCCSTDPSWEHFFPSFFVYVNGSYDGSVVLVVETIILPVDRPPVSMYTCNKNNKNDPNNNNLRRSCPIRVWYLWKF